MEHKAAFPMDNSRLARWRRSLLSLILTTCLLQSGILGTAAQGTDVTVTVEELDISSLPAIRVRTSVRDQNGVPVSGLTAENFEIIEDGQAAFRPTSVDTDSNPSAQVSLAIVIDMYRTLQGEPIEAAQQATRDLLTDLLDQPNDADRAAFVGVRQGLSTDPGVIDESYEVPFTADRNALLNVINFLHERIQTSGPGTPLYDAVIKAIRMAEATEPVGHRAVIVMTDGQDRGSVSEDSDTIQRASNARTPVFAVGLSNSGLDEQYLSRLAENTGGTYQAANTPDDFSRLFSNVLSMLRTQYILTYESRLPEDGQMHSVLVRVRTPTQLEGFQEYRVEMPAAPIEEVEEATQDDAPTSEPSSATPVPEPEPEPAWEGALASIRTWIQDNVLLAALAVGAVGLLFLALVIVVIFLGRRRRAGADEAAILETPEYPSGQPVDFGFEPGGVGPTAGFGPDVADYGTAPAQPPRMDQAPAYGTAPAQPFGVPAAPSPTVSQDGLQPSQEDRTRILDRAPKMPVVGLLMDRDYPTQRLDIAKPTLVVGRSQESDLVVDHNTVSRQHATIKLEGEQFYLYDMASTNGTFVNDEQIHEPTALVDGMTVRFGERAFIFKVISLES